MAASINQDLTTIASAIRDKRNTSNDIPFSKFAEEISDIPSKLTEINYLSPTISTGSFDRTITLTKPILTGKYGVIIGLSYTGAGSTTTSMYYQSSSLTKKLYDSNSNVYMNNIYIYNSTTIKISGYNYTGSSARIYIYYMACSI